MGVGFRCGLKGAVDETVEGAAERSAAVAEVVECKDSTIIGPPVDRVCRSLT